VDDRASQGGGTVTTWASVAAASCVAALLVAVCGASLGRWARGGPLADADESPDQRVHEGSLPRVGGLAVCLAFFACAGPAGGLAPAHIPALGALALGLHDDLRRTDARARLTMLLGLAVAAWALGARVETLVVPGMGEVALGLLGPGVTVLWIVGVVVAFDFLDGLDGLAGGVAAIAAAALVATAAVLDEPPRAAAAAVLLGALLGFLLHNRHPARIQLGDAGSNLVGFLVAVIALGGVKTGTGSHALVAAGLALGVPILDAATTVIRRLKSGALFTSERGHLHHRLLDRGHGHAGAVRTLWCASLVGAIAGLGTLGGGGALAGAMLLAVVAPLGLLWATRAP